LIQLHFNGPNISDVVTAFCETKNTTSLSPGNSDIAIKLLHNQNNEPKRYVHPTTGRRLREPSPPSPTLEESTKTANDTLINHQQQSSLQDEANKTNSRDMDIDSSGSSNKRPLYNHQTCSQSPENTRQTIRMRRILSSNQYKQPNIHPEHAQLSKQPLMKGPPSHTQTVTQIHDLSLWSAEPTRGSEQLVQKSMQPRPKKHTPTSQKELARLDSSDLASSLWDYKKNTAAQFKDPTEMLNAIFYYHFQATSVLDSLIRLSQRKRKLDQNEVTEIKNNIQCNTSL